MCARVVRTRVYGVRARGRGQFPQWQSADASFRFRVFLAPPSRFASFQSSRASPAEELVEKGDGGDESDEEGAATVPDDERGLDWLKGALQFFSSLVQ